MVFELEEQFSEFIVINEVFLDKDGPELFLQTPLLRNQGLQLKVSDHSQ